MKPALQADRNAFIPQLVTTFVQEIRCHIPLFDRGSEKVAIFGLEVVLSLKRCKFWKKIVMDLFDHQ